LTDRQTILIKEIRERCKSEDEFEFEFHWEHWGHLWSPWFLTINGKSQNFSLNDISSEDLNVLCKLGLLVLIKEYDNKETDEDKNDKKRYRLVV
jgi:hypothetical protein